MLGRIFVVALLYRAVVNLNLYFAPLYSQRAFEGAVGFVKHVVFGVAACKLQVVFIERYRIVARVDGSRGVRYHALNRVAVGYSRCRETFARRVVVLNAVVHAFIVG